MCNCTRSNVCGGKSGDEYQSFIFSMALEEKIDPSSIHTYKFQDLTTKFLDSGKEGTFILQKKTNEGRTVQVSIGVPEWLASQLKQDWRRDKQFK